GARHTADRSRRAQGRRSRARCGSPAARRVDLGPPLRAPSRACATADPPLGSRGCRVREGVESAPRANVRQAQIGGFGATLRAYARLMRLDRPIGIWLLLWPTLWALWIAAEGRPDQTVFLVLVLGTIVTRAAGCVINDFADRNIDGYVARTADR